MQLTLFDLLWPLLFVGGGAFIGTRIITLFGPGHAWAGGFAGAIAGGAYFVGLQVLLAREAAQCPHCCCGSDRWDDFEEVEHPTIGFVYRCKCGREFIMRKGHMWLEVLADGNTQLYEKRTFLGKWKKVERA